MKAETYYSKQAILIYLYYNYIVDQQKMQQLMSKSLHTNTNSKLDLNSAFSSDTQPIQHQAWTIYSDSLRFCIQSSGFILTVKTLSCIDNQIALQGSFSYPNGKSLVLPAVFKSKFLQIANKNVQNLYFFTQQGRNQLLLKCSLFFHYNISTSDKINQCASTITAGLPNFQKALQVVGLYHKFNKISYQDKILQIKLKNSIVESFVKNSLQDDRNEKGFLTEQNCSVVRVKNITQSSQNSNTDSYIKKGGYFQVQKRKSIILKEQGQQQEKQLAWKTALNFGSKQHLVQSKMQKQIQLVQKIVNSKHLLTYYVKQNHHSPIYMDYAPQLLKEHIYKKNLSFQQLLNYSEQLVSAVNYIHQSGIVHRDLKPENILIKQGILKIIDYAESSQMDESFVESHFLGCTVPYSPIECALKKEEGFNKKQIDLWSIAIILYELAFKSLPLGYSQIIGPQILEQWRQGNQFSIFPLYRKRKGLLHIQTIISLCSMRGIQVKPSQRLSLKTYGKLLSDLRQFHEALIKI